MTRASPITVSVWPMHPSSMISLRIEPEDAGSCLAWWVVGANKIKTGFR